MTCAEFEFKYLLAVAAYTKLYGYTPVSMIVSQETVLMLNTANVINFTDMGPKYRGVHIGYVYHFKHSLVELGTQYDKLEF